ncbi:BadF/BadG/BcrA/BcrD ATPase family protein [Actinopolymorpha sp. B17G11]|uniref:BadF/BadG/BcrA/BcrD ATPase family protein n=1 Tax=Actinopolymorpha sp. B17G11 TaxID=3160861 RepID=UPI0032E4002F
MGVTVGHVPDDLLQLQCRAHGSVRDAYDNGLSSAAGRRQVVMGDEYVIGVDSGGSHTRVVCVDLDGQMRGSSQAAGGSPTHNVNAKDHVQSAIHEAIRRAGVEVGNAVGLVSGMAGFDGDRDLNWASEYVDVVGLACPRYIVNDAVVAHAGAFAGNSGIIVVAGTGSMIFGITEAGEQIRNDRYFHYAGGARHLSFDAMARILIDEDTDADADLVREVFQFWGASDKQGLRKIVRDHESADRNDVKHFYGRMAQLITAAAETSPLATAACCQLAVATCVGIRLLAGHFESTAVSVALQGGLARSAAFAKSVETELAAAPGKRMDVVDPVLKPAAGAALLALRRAGVDTNERVVRRLAACDQLIR